MEIVNSKQVLYPFENTSSPTDMQALQHRDPCPLQYSKGTYSTNMQISRYLDAPIPQKKTYQNVHENLNRKYIWFLFAVLPFKKKK